MVSSMPGSWDLTLPAQNMLKTAPLLRDNTCDNPVDSKRRELVSGDTIVYNLGGIYLRYFILDQAYSFNT